MLRLRGLYCTPRPRSELGVDAWRDTAIVASLLIA
jgi:hypothetical protein